MGLDVYAVVEEADADGNRSMLANALFKDINPVLAGGMLSGHGNGNSFRGAIYDDFIRHISNVSLYQEHIPNLTVQKILVAVEEFLKDKPSEKTLQKMDISLAEVEALKQWLTVVAEAGGGIHGWW